MTSPLAPCSLVRSRSAGPAFPARPARPSSEVALLSPSSKADSEDALFFDAHDGFDPAARAQAVRIAAAEAGRVGQPYFSGFVEARRSEVVGGFAFRGEALEGVIAEAAGQLFSALGGVADRTARRCAASAPEVASSLARGTMTAAWGATCGAANAVWSFWTYPLRLPFMLFARKPESAQPPPVKA